MKKGKIDKILKRHSIIGIILAIVLIIWMLVPVYAFESYFNVPIYYDIILFTFFIFYSFYLFYLNQFLNINLLAGKLSSTWLSYRTNEKGKKLMSVILILSGIFFIFLTIITLLE